MSEEQTMIERVARALAKKDDTHRHWRDLDASSQIIYRGLARAAIEAMKDAPLDVLGVMFEAMFEDKWDGTQAPMVGAGWEAGIDAALDEKA